MHSARDVVYGFALLQNGSSTNLGVVNIPFFPVSSQLDNGARQGTFCVALPTTRAEF